MNDISKLEQPYARALSGADITNPPPALIPPRTPLVGRYITLEPQNAEKHAAALYRARSGVLHCNNAFSIFERKVGNGQIRADQAWF